MLYSVELRLRVMGGDDPRQVTGYHLLSFFLRLIEGVNPALAAKLHEDAGPRPFTISPLAPVESGQRRLALAEGARACLRLTFLQEEVFAFLADAVWRLQPEASLPLGGARVACEGLATTPAQSPRAAFASFQELLEGAAEERKLRLAFLSPTTFRSKGERNILFPEPALVMGSLLARWNAHAPPGLHLRAANPSQVRLSGYRLATRMLDFGSYQELGFGGIAMYECGEELAAEQVKALNALADFAFYAGVGAKTTMGMGQCRRIERAYPLSHRARDNPEERGRPPGSD